MARRRSRPSSASTPSPPAHAVHRVAAATTADRARRPVLGAANRWDLLAGDVDAAASTPRGGPLLRPAGVAAAHVRRAGRALDPAGSSSWSPTTARPSPPPSPPSGLPARNDPAPGRQAVGPARPATWRPPPRTRTSSFPRRRHRAGAATSPAWRPGRPLPDALVVGRRGHVDLTGWSPAATVEWLAGRREPRRCVADPAWLATATGEPGPARRRRSQLPLRHLGRDGAPPGAVGRHRRVRRQP